MNLIIPLLLFQLIQPGQTADGTGVEEASREETPTATRDATASPPAKDATAFPQDASSPPKEQIPEPQKPVPKATPKPRPAQVKEPQKATQETKPVSGPSRNTFIPFGKFGFGSYGRVNFGSNMDGEPIYPVNITAHGPRLEESTYLELDLYYSFNPMADITTKTVATLALSDSLFHYNGDWSTAMAIRNLYLEFKKRSIKGLSFWVGSRMYRGDDIYLLDYWPLDNLNTLGAGIWYNAKPIRAGLHVGTNRILGDYQYQEASVSTPFVGEQRIPTLNRQRTIASFKLEYWKQFKDAIGFKVKGYSEFHSLPSGTYNALGEEVERIELPSETGYVAGLQVGVWGFAPKSFVNLFVRYGKGLGAYGEFSAPAGLGWSPDLDTSFSVKAAQDIVVALSANYLIPNRFGLMAGAYYRSFKDADGLEYDWDDGQEVVFALRPHLWIPELMGKSVVLAGEVSYQQTSRSGLHPETEEVASPTVWKFSFIPTWISGGNTYARPAVRLVYTMAMPNEDARLWYHQYDYRRTRSVEHFIGIQAEWWFNSSTYQ